MKEKIYGYDIIRVLACIMVVILHSPRPGEIAGNNGMFISALSFFTAPCIPLFFMLSGALLLGSEMNTGTFLRKRFGKFAIPLIIWSIIYLIDKLILGKIDTVSGFVKGVLSIPFSAQEGVLWFMYTLSGLYLLAPVINPWLKSTSKNTIIFYLSLWCITLCYPYFEDSLNLHTLITPRADILYYFSGFVGYFVLGWFLKNYILPDSSYQTKGLLFLLLGCVAFTLLKGIDKTLNLGLDEHDGFWFQSFAVAWFCVFWWFFCIYLSKQRILNITVIKKCINVIANYSFGIYLCHIIIMRPWLWNCPFIVNIDNYPLQTATIVICDFGLSLLLCIAISYLPFSKYLIAFTHKKSFK